MIKLENIIEPKFTFFDFNNEKVELDPWEVSEKLQKLGVGDQLVDTFENIRRAFGFPTQEEVDKAEEPKPKTLSRGQCMHLNTELAVFIGNLDVSKKQRALSQK